MEGEQIHPLHRQPLGVFHQKHRQQSLNTQQDMGRHLEMKPMQK
jgi:hypothetical protein